MKYILTTEDITPEVIAEIIDKKRKIILSDQVKLRIERCREYLNARMEHQEAPIYGINTGFGSLCNVKVATDALSKLQHNLIVSHACGMGDEVPPEITRIILLLKIRSLSYGYSGVQLATVERLIDFFNDDILPVIYEQGSLGASGDLSPLAHMSLPLLGLGEVYYRGERMSAESMLQKQQWEPIVLQSKEGLSLINGTQFMCAYAVWSLMRGEEVYRWANKIVALSLDSFLGRIEPFHAQVHRIRAHAGQIAVAADFRHLLRGSELMQQDKAHVQDPYSFRCIPQVHGASKMTLDFCRMVITTEINSVTDNPTIVPEQDLIISAGNFHGEPLALIMDYMGIALAELASISGQRVYQLIKGLRGLPQFLTPKSGLNSGFMIPQYSVASIVSQNKQLATPASVDSIESSQGQEDHVSMGANAATKLRRIVLNCERVLGVELFNAAQALAFRRPLKTSQPLERLVDTFRKEVPFIEDDEVMYTHMHAATRFIQTHKACKE